MSTADTPILIVGSGGNGIALAALLDAAGHRNFLIITKQADFGGAWLENTYPGCEVDNPSAVYEFEFHRNVGWTALFAKQPELLTYFKDVATKYALYERTSFGVELLSAHWSSDDLHWVV
ncbi:MAG: NAD(P)-binding protein, partial [Actinomycetales bacterium]